MSANSVIHVVDDDASFCKAVSRLLHINGYAVVTYHTAEEYLSGPNTGKGCILLDVRMPGISGLQTQALLNERKDPLPVIFVTGHGDIPMSVRTIKAGAEDFLTKPIAKKRLFDAIESALARYDRTHVQRKRLQELRQCFGYLTQREIEVFKAVVAGSLNREIALRLDITERTVKAHRHQVMEKMKASSLAELVDMARQLGSAIN